MRIGITTYGSRVSPLFDAAEKLLLMDVDGDQFRRRGEVTLGSLGPALRVAKLDQFGVQVLVCGGISGFFRDAIVARGIRIHAWISGEVGDVLGVLALRYLASLPTATETEGTSPILAIAAEGPSLDAAINSCPSRCRYLLFVRMEDMQFTVHKNEERQLGGRALYNARLIRENKSRVLLTGRCGANDLGILSAAAIEVVAGACGTVREAIERYRRGELTATQPSSPRHRRRRRRKGRGRAIVRW